VPGKRERRSGVGRTGGAGPGASRPVTGSEAAQRGHSGQVRPPRVAQPAVALRQGDRRSPAVATRRLLDCFHRDAASRLRTDAARGSDARRLDREEESRAAAGSRGRL